MAISCFAALILTWLFCSALLNEVNGYPNQTEEEEAKRYVENELRESENKDTNRQRRGVEGKVSWTDNPGPIGNDVRSAGPEKCFLCPSSNPGPSGAPGPPGSVGKDGRDGRDWNGYSGSEETREPRPTTVSSGGAVFVRWGRRKCPSSSDLVYSGIAAGAHYAHKGSGSNYLCMPEVPIYDEPMAGTGGNRALVYGAEYEMDTYTQWYHLHDNNVPCAVCLASSRPSLLMVPARNVCPGSDWTTEYAGYLVADFFNHRRTQFVCMDKTPVVIARSSHNANGALFYVAEGRCGGSGSGLPCGPYVDGYELTCAVCTR